MQRKEKQTRAQRRKMFERNVICMNSPSRLLLLEDNPHDAELICRTLRVQWPGCEVVLVNNEPAFQTALQHQHFSLILSDYLLPGFDGLAALAAARSRCPDIPFIFISGAID